MSTAPLADSWGVSRRSGFLPTDPDGPGAALGRDMARRWLEGERPLVEEYLAQHAELADRPDAALDLIYEEICLRQQYAMPLDAAALLARFPRWRERVQMLLDCHRLLGSDTGETDALPKPGAMLGDYRLLAELGRGAEGRVYLAAQPALADRAVVLKVSPLGGHEHLSLARLQHTNIVPLYAVHDDAARGLRILCMPYFGSASLHVLLSALRETPAADRDGTQLLQALDADQHLPPPTRSPARDFLARATYPQALAWLGACLAQGLHYAHERGLVHLDVKPANVLVAADGQPMLLDFHLAQPPIAAGATPPPWLGGTLMYMAPEHLAAMEAVRGHRAVVRAVDGRADLYSLGVLLYEALGGALPMRADVSPPLHQVNRAVSPGLSDIVARCLAPDPRARYADGPALADDLRRHLTDRPLVGVRNRSFRERWVKWRRRQPHGLKMATLALLTLAVLTVAGSLLYDRAEEPRRRAVALRRQVAALFHVADEQLHKEQYESAAETLKQAGALTEELPAAEDLQVDLRQRMHAARQGQTVRLLGQFADRVRLLAPFDGHADDVLREAEAGCRAVWERRALIQERLSDDVADRPRLQSDLLDLAVLGAELRARMEGAVSHGAALAMLDEAAALFGPSAALERGRRALGGQPAEAPEPRTAWEHYALGRSLLRDGDLDAASHHLDEAARLQPDGLWPAFYQGQCAFRRGRHGDAVIYFSICIGRAPTLAACPFNRAMAFAAQGDAQAALADYGRALDLDPTLGTAYLNRGLLHFRRLDYTAAESDLQSALDRGAAPAAACYNLALVQNAHGNRAAARANAVRALQHDAGHAAARELLGQLDGIRLPPRKVP